MNNSEKDDNSGLFSQQRLISRQKRAIKMRARGTDFLVERVAEDIKHRLSATNRNFTNGVDLFSFSGKLSQTLAKLTNVETITRYEMPQISQILQQFSDCPIRPLNNDFDQVSVGLERGVDLVVSAFGLHSSNNLVAMMREILAAMKEDGFLMMVLPARGTLAELRDCLMRAELELTNGAASRIDPFITLQQAGILLQSTGFKLPVVDREDVTVRYDDVFALIDDLRAMGVTSALNHSNYRRAHRNLFRRTNELYQENYSDGDGRIRASFCFAYLAGWSAHENQQTPLKPGSAKASLKEHLAKNKKN